ncbi:MAG TPA: carotenoid biosynthesis protein [Anaerolineales bacterium]
MRLRAITTVLLIGYAALTAYIILRYLFGSDVPSFFTPLLTLLAFVFAVLHAGQTMGWGRSILLLALTFTVSLAFESVGVATGLVYGPYHYTDLLGPKFLGLVPYLIPLAWFMMAYPAFTIASRLIPSNWRLWPWRLGVAALGGVVMTAWDVAMDPLMVAAGHWVWEVKGAYFGVPLQNYWGWWLTIFASFFLFIWLGGLRPPQEVRRPTGFEQLAVYSYLTTGLGSVLLGLEHNLGGAALAGLFAMLPWMLLGLQAQGQVGLEKIEA